MLPEGNNPMFKLLKARQYVACLGGSVKFHMHVKEEDISYLTLHSSHLLFEAPFMY